MNAELITRHSSPITKPRKIVVPLAVAQAWGNEDGWIAQEKLDGKFALLHVGYESETLGE